MATVKILVQTFSVISHWTLALCETLFVSYTYQHGEDAKL